MKTLSARYNKKVGNASQQTWLWFSVAVGIPLLLLSAFSLHTASAQTAAELQSEIDTHSQQITALEKEIATYESQLQVVGTEKRTLLSAVRELDLSRQKVAATISVEQKKIATTEIQIGELAQDISTKEEIITQSRGAIAQSLRRRQKTDDFSFIESILQEGSLATLWKELEGDQQLQGALSDYILELSDAKVTLESSLNESTQKQQELINRRKTLLAQRQALEATKAAKDRLLSETKEKESTYQEILEEKRAQKIAFENALNELESKLAFTLDPSKIPSAGSGALSWPLDDVYITQKFGNTAFANAGAYNGSGHNGVDFRASVGTPVRAALGGTVIGSGNTDAYRGCYSYGKWVLVKHGNGLSTLYAHLSEILVGQGEQVGTRDILGLSGNTGYSTGPHLHFSVFASDAVQIRKLGEIKKKTNCAQAAIPVSGFEGYLNPLEFLKE